MEPQNTQNTQIECDVTSFVMSGHDGRTYVPHLRVQRFEYLSLVAADIRRPGIGR
jgi:hypothetical protein